MKNSLLACLLAIAPMLACANEGKEVQVAEGRFAAQVRAVEKSLSDGQTYAELPRADRNEVRAILARMAERLEGVDDVGQLSEADRLAVFNDQERVNAILEKGYADSRLVCERRGRTGTHMRESKCQTVAERRRRAEVDQENMRQLQRAPMPQEGL
ncbi:hypothetical protein [Arenimonas caeni]|jgi:hypothetical protein|uniref:Uncharacterized protein n=1 Tax=Arenimonas caeni TaxID=2058085 RepID=A0A2P6MAQ4_9GAMM|nr:hypothetical protein [Arenimonas caeni]MDY0022127.1 hypothetical protein [Arenimonas caeni]PRH83032.1 hypothetical protein C6N40_05170 [Arenimonas caeni]